MNKNKAERAAKNTGLAPVTVTCEEAEKRHPGTSARQFQRLCIRGAALFNKHRGKLDEIPAEKKGVVLFAKKLGKSWQIPVKELDRIFLPVDSESLNK